MSRGTWANFKPPDWVDPEAFLFCGADPSWTPEKEGIATAPPPPGECPHCRSRGCYAHDAEGNLLRDEEGEPIFLRGAIEDGSHAVCPRCRRYGRDYLLDRTPMGVMMRQRDEAVSADGVGDDADDRPRVDASGKLDLSSLLADVRPPDEPGYVTKATAAGSVTVPERWAHLLDGR